MAKKTFSIDDNNVGNFVSIPIFTMQYYCKG